MKGIRGLRAVQFNAPWGLLQLPC
uniref:Uncharacterized protein n=1 Tax=Rhizophora mucronata TaxID=61149 RepID=A0A2P2NVL5_RHIMU